MTVTRKVVPCVSRLRHLVYQRTLCIKAAPPCVSTYLVYLVYQGCDTLCINVPCVSRL